MGLFQNLLATYDACSSAVGIAPNDKDEKKVFLPLFHMTFKSHVCVTIDGSGSLIGITRDEKERTITIPCSEKSASRSSGIAAHPLCDQLAYVDRDLAPDKFEAYRTALASWKGGNAKLGAVYTYVTEHSVAEDMKNAALFKESEYEEQNGTKVLSAEKITKIGVRFSVCIPGDPTPKVWEDRAIRELWIERFSACGEAGGFDYLSGEPIGQLAGSHPKNINSMTGNAKLISCNDAVGFTYRGRFTQQDEALQISTLASYKAHNTLRWLIANYALRTDTQAIVVWAVDADTEEKIKPDKSSSDVLTTLDGETTADEADERTDSEKLTDAAVEVDSNYAAKVARALRGIGNAEFGQHDKKVVTAIFDAATTGRMGVTFYREFPKHEYLESIAKWHEETSWHLAKFEPITRKDADGNVTEAKKLVRYVGCPSFRDILNAAYGGPKGGSDKGYNSLKREIQKQLIECMFGNFALPKSFLDLAAARASNPLSFDVDNYNQEINAWRATLNVACALARNYYRHFEIKEDIKLELEEDRTDRDYLYGRLLAVADKLESRALYQANKEEAQQRTTNAIRLLSAFVNQPYKTWGILDKQLHPYINQLHGAGFHMKLIGEILAAFKQGEYEDNSPLSPMYMLGFHLQTRALFNKNKETQEEN